MYKFDIQTPAGEAIIDITGSVEGALRQSRVKSGICLVYVPHTTAGVIINENADPDVRRDILMTLERTAPAALPYAHAEGNAPAHVKASLLGASAFIPLEDGSLALGTWQGIFFCEFDGPRRRRVFVEIISG